MNNVLNDLFEQVKKDKKRIVLPESLEERTLRAADEVLEKGLAEIFLLGKREEILMKAASLGLKSVEKANFFDVQTDPKRKHYAEIIYELRKHKGLSLEKADALLDNPLYLACAMIKNGDVDGEVAGAQNATGDVLRPALQLVKMKKGMSVVSGAFLMFLSEETYGEQGLLVFADCAVMPDPTASQLAEIAIASASTAKVLGGFKDPRVAMLSFSTKGSASHPAQEKVFEATRIAQKTAPDLLIDGELQLDAAIVSAVAESKSPGSAVAGKANVLVFPDLNSGNIGYKLVQRLAGAKAIGPVLQGMAAPVNDLSRGCSVNDIVEMIVVTSNQARLK